MAQSPEFERFQEIADRITDAIDFFESLGGMQNHSLDRVEFFTSHEGLHLELRGGILQLCHLAGITISTLALTSFGLVIVLVNSMGRILNISVELQTQ